MLGPQLCQQLFQRFLAYAGAQCGGFGLLPAFPLLGCFGAEVDKFSAYAVQYSDVFGPSCLKRVVLGRSESQGIEFPLLGLPGLAGLRQFALQSAVTLQPLAVVAVELQQLMVLGRQRFWTGQPFVDTRRP